MTNLNMFSELSEQSEQSEQFADGYIFVENTGEIKFL